MSLIYLTDLCVCQKINEERRKSHNTRVKHQRQCHEEVLKNVKQAVSNLRREHEGESKRVMLWNVSGSALFKKAFSGTVLVKLWYSFTHLKRIILFWRGKTWSLMGSWVTMREEKGFPHFLSKWFFCLYHKHKFYSMSWIIVWIK